MQTYIKYVTSSCQRDIDNEVVLEQAYYFVEIQVREAINKVTNKSFIINRQFFCIWATGLTRNRSEDMPCLAAFLRARLTVSACKLYFFLQLR